DQPTVLFLDEIHRFNKSQQDTLLPFVEDGTIVLFGATTENPSFEIISALLSRCRVITLNPLAEQGLDKLIERALNDAEHGLGSLNLKLSLEARKFLCETSRGDARFLLNTLETIATLSKPGQIIELADVEKIFDKRALHYDKSGEEHYNVISAFIKSMRGSDPDAALYYLARMLEAGEEPLFVARRMVIFASEDIGNANPDAINVAISCMQAFDFVGMPEGWIPLAQCASYLASSPKSNASYAGYKKAKADVHTYGPLPVPMHLRNAPTKMMKEMGYGKNYQYAHDRKDHIVIQQHLPDRLKDKKYYEPDGIGYEKKIMEWLLKVRSQ
ncbi:MAG TPA: AAA family ATPase, partial [Deltaproteobacteria bacterium]|nr:AAA family ATPase [Deltaproteobacteria bacterium]